MKLLVTGATGFTGSYVIQSLVANGFKVACLVRPTSDRSTLVNGIDVRIGDLSDPESLARALNGIETLVNVASIGFGHAQGIADVARQAGVRRAVFFSTTAIFTSLDAKSKVARIAAEKSIAGSGLDYTILRPTMIYGSSRDRNMCRLISYLRRWPAIPVVGSGEYLMQPVYVGDLAEATIRCLQEPATIGQSYNLAGKTPLTYNQVIDTVCQAIGRSVLKLPLPSRPILATLRLLEGMGARPPIKAEQVRRLNEHKAFPYEEAARDFGYSPRDFDSGIRLELCEMGIRST